MSMDGVKQVLWDDCSVNLFIIFIMVNILINCKNNQNHIKTKSFEIKV